MCPVVPTHNILAVAAGAGKNKKKIKLVACALWPVPCAPDFSKRITPGAALEHRRVLPPGLGLLDYRTYSSAIRTLEFAIRRPSRS